MTTTFNLSKPVCIAIISPSGYVPDHTVVERAIARLEHIGCRVINYYDITQSEQRFGAPYLVAKQQIEQAISDPDVDIIMSLRGGYGVFRILPLLDFTKLANSKKIFMGHSDFTAINMALLAHGAISFTGPMLSSDFGLENMSQFTLENFVTILLNPQYCIRVHAQNEVCAVEGTLWGGNLAMINSLLGTPYFPKIKEGILFLEDINEHPYKIERMLLQLLSAGILQQQKAIVLGDFSEYKLTEYDRGYNFDTMLSFVRSKVKVPILIGLPFGHIVNKLTLPIGAKAKLSSTGNAFELQLSGYPYLSV